MKTAKLFLIVLSFTLFMSAGCTRHHSGRPHGGPFAQEFGSKVEKLVGENVKDPQKAKQVQGLVDEIVKEVQKTSQQVHGFHEQLAALNANYNAKPEEFTKILDQLNNSRMESAARILQTRFKIKDLLTAEEWKNLSDAMNKERREREPGRMGGMHGGSMSPSAGY